MTDNPHYVTPEEAEKIGCVMSMMRNNPNIVYQTCLGPKCMAWRWKEHSPKHYFLGTHYPPESNWVKVGDNHYIDTPTHGYCGMGRS